MKNFKRQQFKLKRLGEKWRKPKGKQSKLRLEKKGKGKRVKIGFGSNKSEKNKIKFKGELKNPIIVRNVKDLEKIDLKKDYVIIASSVGKKKRATILNILKNKISKNN